MTIFDRLDKQPLFEMQDPSGVQAMLETINRLKLETDCLISRSRKAIADGHTRYLNGTTQWRSGDDGGR